MLTFNLIESTFELTSNLFFMRKKSNCNDVQNFSQCSYHKVVPLYVHSYCTYSMYNTRACFTVLILCNIILLASLVSLQEQSLY